MGQSTNGQLAWGVVFDEGIEFPWDSEEFDGDAEDWWATETGWVSPVGAPYADTPSGYAPGFSRDDPRIDEYYDSKRSWLKDHPLPFKEVNYCSGDYPMYMLVVPGSLVVAYRGEPEAVDVTALQVSADEQQALLSFCDKYDLVFSGEPGWYLSSYWG